MVALNTTIFDFTIVDGSKFRSSTIGCIVYLNFSESLFMSETFISQDNSLWLESHNSWLHRTISVWGMHFCCYKQFLHGVLITFPEMSPITYKVNNLFCRWLPAQLVSFSLESCLSLYGALENS